MTGKLWLVVAVIGFNLAAIVNQSLTFHSRTSVSLLATTQPAEPAPTTMKSYSSPTRSSLNGLLPPNSCVKTKILLNLQPPNFQNYNDTLNIYSYLNKQMEIDIRKCRASCKVAFGPAVCQVSWLPHCLMIITLYLVLIVRTEMKSN